MESKSDSWFLNRPSATKTMLLAMNSVSSYMSSAESKRLTVLERTGPTTQGLREPLSLRGRSSELKSTQVWQWQSFQMMKLWCFLPQLLSLYQWSLQEQPQQAIMLSWSMGRPITTTFQAVDQRSFSKSDRYLAMLLEGKDVPALESAQSMVFRMKVMFSSEKLPWDSQCAQLAITTMKRQGTSLSMIIQDYQTTKDL